MTCPGQRVVADAARLKRRRRPVGSASLGVFWGDNTDVEACSIAASPYRSDRLALAGGPSVHPDHPLAGRKSLRFARTARAQSRRSAADDRGAQHALQRAAAGVTRLTWLGAESVSQG